MTMPPTLGGRAPRTPAEQPVSDPRGAQCRGPRGSLSEGPFCRKPFGRLRRGPNTGLSAELLDMPVRTPRLPGLRFETQPPPPTITLPRMDIAAFVGFAAAGPLHRPVAIEDPGEFTNVFGQDLPLAWDPERGEVENAYLAPAVRAFFRNGGRRCWVIRVADTPRTVGRLRPPNGRPAARSNTYPLVGLVGLALDTGAGRQASVVARSEGSWSDGVRVGAELEVEPLSILASLQDAAGTVQIAADAQTNIAPGDLVRLTFVESDYVVLLGVETLLTEPRGLPLSPLDLHGQGQWAGGSQAWFSARIPPDLASRATSARVFDGAAEPTPLPLVSSGLNTQTGALVLRLAVDAGELPGVGTLVHVEFGTSPRQTAWLTVADVVPPGDRRRLRAS